MYLLYSALLAVGMVLASPFWIWQMLRHGKYRKGFEERWGWVPERISREPHQPAIWVHAVSVGEVLAVSGLMEALRQRFPQHRVVVSTTTDTGQKLARDRFGAGNVFYLPLDFAFAIRPYLTYLRPELVILAETEFWPNFLRLARESGAHVAVVNARISDRSWPGYRRFRPLLRRALEQIDLFLAQTEEDQRRLLDIGAPEGRVYVSGNLKADVPEPSEPEILSALKIALLEENVGPVIVCGSTVEGEETMLVRTFKFLLPKHSNMTMLLAPRHPERFDPVVDLLQKGGIHFLRRSQWDGTSIAGKVFLLDSIGELAALYALADVAFVGGSLVPSGGHNILEPARYGAAIVVGEHTKNFRDIVDLFRAQRAVRVTSPSNLVQDFTDLLANEAERIALGQRAVETMQAQAGATERTLNALGQLLKQA
jgi:3-deoxy-D-manno-octulosonic-acid transferase